MIQSSDLLDRYPLVEDLRRKAKKRVPHFVWEFLESGTGRDEALARNRASLDRIVLKPRYLKPAGEVSLKTRLFGKDYDQPFGVAALGSTGLIWSGGEKLLAAAAARCNMPYCLSSVACETPETVGPIAAENGWFQLYPADESEVRDDLIRRARKAGFKTLILTVDVPEYGRRERPRRAGLRYPPRTSAKMALQMALRPAWLANVAINGAPAFRTVEPYAGRKDLTGTTEFVLNRMSRRVDAAYCAAVRDSWPGAFVIKGIVHPDDALACVKLGADGVVVSNHGARQFDGAPAAIDCLEEIVTAVSGRLTVTFDSGIRSGLDIARAFSRGADFAFVGRAFLYGIAALGEKGGDHVAALLRSDLANNMNQLGLATIEELKELSRVVTRTEPLSVHRP